MCACSFFFFLPFTHLCSCVSFLFLYIQNAVFINILLNMKKKWKKDIASVRATVANSKKNKAHCPISNRVELPVTSGYMGKSKGVFHSWTNTMENVCFAAAKGFYQVPVSQKLYWQCLMQYLCLHCPSTTWEEVWQTLTAFYQWCRH